LRSITYQGRTGQARFEAPFDIEVAADAQVTVNAVVATFTVPARGVILLDTPLVSNYEVVITALFGDAVSPVIGTFAATGLSVPFAPIAGRDFNIQIGTPGSASATVRLERSLDGGVTYRALTYPDGTIIQWTAGVNTSWQEIESGALYRLNCTAYTSSTPYRVSQ
jgi:hypothetical protein